MFLMKRQAGIAMGENSNKRRSNGSGTLIKKRNNPSDQRGALLIKLATMLTRPQDDTQRSPSGATQLNRLLPIFYPVTRWSVENCTRRSDLYDLLSYSKFSLPGMLPDMYFKLWAARIKHATLDGILHKWAKRCKTPAIPNQARRKRAVPAFVFSTKTGSVGQVPATAHD